LVRGTYDEKKKNLNHSHCYIGCCCSFKPFGHVYCFYIRLVTRPPWNTNVKYYEKKRASYDCQGMVLPKLADLPPYKAVEYGHMCRQLLFFNNSSVALKVKYSKETYEA
jgi:hypothetical protein